VSGRNPREAATNFITFIKETLSCITDHYLNPYPQSDTLYKVYYEPYAVVHARGGGKYCLSVTQIFRAVPHPEAKDQFKAKTQEYSYRLMRGPDEQAEILAYHWHPNDPGVKYPHLHVKEIPKVHLPTSRVCLEDFVEMLMRDYRVRPRKSHSECKEILQRNKRAFEKMATWKIQNP
jgi:hypothetical protein